MCPRRREIEKGMGREGWRLGKFWLTSKAQNENKKNFLGGNLSRTFLFINYLENIRFRIESNLIKIGSRLKIKIRCLQMKFWKKCCWCSKVGCG